MKSGSCDKYAAPYPYKSHSLALKKLIFPQSSASAIGVPFKSSISSIWGKQAFLTCF
jgi:hypothetical protein